MEFTKRDRDFIVKLSKELDATKKRLALLEKGTPKSVQGNVLSPVQLEHFDDGLHVMHETENKLIEVRFKNHSVDALAREILVKSILTGIERLCEANDIEAMIVSLLDM